MHDLSVRTLVPQQELDFLLCGGKVSVTIHRIQRPQPVPSKEPPESRASRIARFHKPRCQSLLAAIRLRLNPQLIDRRLSPREGLVQLRVRSFDRRVPGKKISEVFPIRRADRARLVCQIGKAPAEGLLGCCRGRITELHQQRINSAGIAPGIEVQDKLQRPGMWSLLIRRQDTGLRSRHCHRGGVLRRIEMKNIEARPLGIRNPLRGRPVRRGRRPHPLHHGIEAQRQIHRADRLDFVEDHRACLSRHLRRKHDLANGEVGVSIGNGGVIRLHIDLRRLPVHIDGDCIIRHVHCHVHIVQNLPWEDPRFERSVLTPEDGAPRPHHRERQRGDCREADTGRLRRQPFAYFTLRMHRRWCEDAQYRDTRNPVCGQPSDHGGGPLATTLHRR